MYIKQYKIKAIPVNIKIKIKNIKYIKITLYNEKFQPHNSQPHLTTQTHFHPLYNSSHLRKYSLHRQAALAVVGICYFRYLSSTFEAYSATTSSSGKSCKGLKWKSRKTEPGTHTAYSSHGAWHSHGSLFSPPSKQQQHAFY